MKIDSKQSMKLRSSVSSKSLKNLFAGKISFYNPLNNLSWLFV